MHFKEHCDRCKAYLGEAMGTITGQDLGYRNSNEVYSLCITCTNLLNKAFAKCVEKFLKGDSNDNDSEEASRNLLQKH